MIVSIRMTTSSGRPVEKLPRDIEVAAIKGGRKGITNIARMITRQLKVEVPVWNENLQNSIHSKSLSENEVGVFMNWYGALVAKGHPINTISMSQHSAFWRWIQDKAWGSPFMFRKALLRKGYADPNDFITRGLMKVENKYGQEALMAIRQSLKETGFKEG